MTINIISLAQECQKNPSLINLCKGHNQSLCKLALQQSGYTNELDKWHGRYCFVVKHLLKVISHSDKKLKLKNGKKILDIIKSEKLKVPQDVQRFIQKNIINQLGSGPDDIDMPTIPKSSKVFNFRQLSKELDDLDKVNELEHRIQQLENNLSDNQEVKLRQIKKLDEMREEIKHHSRKILASDSDESSFFDQQFSNIIDKIPKSSTMSAWPYINQLLEKEEAKPRGSVSMKVLKDVLHKISPHLSDALSSIPISGIYKLDPAVIGKAQSYFNPGEEGEIFIDKNDLIKIEDVYANGKAYGEVLYTDKKGFFPLTVFME